MLTFPGANLNECCNQIVAVAKRVSPVSDAQYARLKSNNCWTNTTAKGAGSVWDKETMTQELNSEPDTSKQQVKFLKMVLDGPRHSFSSCTVKQVFSKSFPTLSWSGHSFLFDVLGEVFKESFTQSAFLLHSVTLCTSFLSLLSPFYSL